MSGTCPLCGLTFPAAQIEQHVNQCLDSSFAGGAPASPRSLPAKRSSSKISPNHTEDDDFALALRLQQEEEAAAAPATKCQLCSHNTAIDDLYILDECQHKFCNKCIRQYVEQTIMTSVSVTCPIRECSKALSVRDMKDLLPKKPKVDGFGSKAVRPTAASGQATKRLIAELTHILESSPEKSGYSVEPIDDNMYLWELRLFNFDKKTEPLANDLDALRMDHILLRISFPPTYPMNPPFVRVIKPRFAFRTGHVTIGGSICTELLTNKGWSPANTIEAVIMSVRAGFQEGNARLDLHNRHEYTEAEAKDAFDRMVQTHGWY